MAYTYLAKTFFGLEPVLAREITALGGQNVQILNRAVRFEGDRKLLYKANLCLRSAVRIIEPLLSFKANSTDELYEATRQIKWQQFINTRTTFAVHASVSNSPTITHSQYAGLRVKDAIADTFMERLGERPSVDPERPDIGIDLHVYGDDCTISLDSSGDSLHRRGYRSEADRAPLNEVLAAGMILTADWNKEGDFMDFLCGSGTLPIEAAMYAMNIAPGKFRNHFCFMGWPDFDLILWKRVLQEALEAEVPYENGTIFGSDISQKVLAMAEENIYNAGLEKVIELEMCDFRQAMPDLDRGIVILNPPYGERIDPRGENPGSVREFYQEIGFHLRDNFKGFEAWVISSDIDAMKGIPMKPTERFDLFNGGLNCRFNHYHIFTDAEAEAYKLSGQQAADEAAARREMQDNERISSANSAATAASLTSDDED